MKKILLGAILLFSIGSVFGQTMRTSKTLAETKVNTNKITVSQEYLDGEVSGEPLLIWSAGSASSNSVSESLIVVLSKDEAITLRESLDKIALQGTKGALISNKKYDLYYGSGSQPITFTDKKHYEAFKWLRIKDAIAISDFIKMNIEK